MKCSYKNRSHGKNISKENIRGHVFVVFVLIYPLSKFGGNRTNSLWVLAFYSVLFKWKSWLEKTALNMSIRRVIFTSDKNLKPLFLFQYLIFLRIFSLDESSCLDLYINLKITISTKWSVWRCTVTLIEWLQAYIGYSWVKKESFTWHNKYRKNC